MQSEKYNKLLVSNIRISEDKISYTFINDPCQLSPTYTGKIPTFLGNTIEKRINKFLEYASKGLYIIEKYAN